MHHDGGAAPPAPPNLSKDPYAAPGSAHVDRAGASPQNLLSVSLSVPILDELIARPASNPGMSAPPPVTPRAPPMNVSAANLALGTDEPTSPHACPSPQTPPATHDQHLDLMIKPNPSAKPTPAARSPRPAYPSPQALLHATDHAALTADPLPSPSNRIEMRTYRDALLSPTRSHSDPLPRPPYIPRRLLSPLTFILIHLQPPKRDAVASAV